MAKKRSGNTRHSPLKDQGTSTAQEVKDSSKAAVRKNTSAPDAGQGRRRNAVADFSEFFERTKKKIQDLEAAANHIYVPTYSSICLQHSKLACDDFIGYLAAQEVRLQACKEQSDEEFTRVEARILAEIESGHPSDALVTTLKDPRTWVEYLHFFTQPEPESDPNSGSAKGDEETSEHTTDQGRTGSGRGEASSAQMPTSLLAQSQAHMTGGAHTRLFCISALPPRRRSTFYESLDDEDEAVAYSRLDGEEPVFRDIFHWTPDPYPLPRCTMKTRRMDNILRHLDICKVRVISADFRSEVLRINRNLARQGL